MADSKTVLKIAELGLAGKTDELVAYLEEVAVAEVNNNRRGLYNGIKKLLKSLRTEPSLSTSQNDSNYIDFAEDSIWIPESVKLEIKQFTNFYQNKNKLRNRAQLNHLNKLLLYGPPGTGKTTIGFYVGHQLGLPVRYIRIADVMSSKFGETLRNIADLFNSTNPEVIFIDEFDAFAKSRTDSQDVGELKRIVNSIIQTLDFHSQNKVVIVATNLIDSIDPAIVRRFPFQIHVGNLNFEEASKFFEFLASRDSGYEIKLNSKETRFLVSLGNLLTLDAVRTFFDKTLVAVSMKDKEIATFEDFLDTLLSSSSSKRAELKDLKEESPEQLRVAAVLLKRLGYTQEEIAKRFGIHRNSYLKYFGE